MDQPTRERALASALREMGSCYLRVLCPAQARCSKVTELPLATLVRHSGGSKTLDELLPRLLCKSCRSRAGRVELYGPRVTAPGSYAPAESAWHVVLVE